MRELCIEYLLFSTMGYVAGGCRSAMAAVFFLSLALIMDSIGRRLFSLQSTHISESAWVGGLAISISIFITLLLYPLFPAHCW